MKVLVVGGGGREHALAWSLRRSPEVRVLRCAPGNAGMAGTAECVAIAADDVESLTRHALSERYDLVVVGPEIPLVAGLADRLRDGGLAVFGPSAAAAAVEGSKVFAKEFMARHGIPAAPFRIFDDARQARDHLGTVRMPVVIKADGLAAGKGVVIARDALEAVAAAEGMLSGAAFGAAGRTIVVEECLEGREVSFFVLSDGERFVALDSCQDYKRAQDGDRGPNTGGMGSYSPSAFLTAGTRTDILGRVVAPVIAGLRAEGRPYRGVLYVGLMLCEDGPRVLEFNARFGDPETQSLLPRLDGDWLPLLRACAAGDLGALEPRWRPEAAVCVVMASRGYPGSGPTGLAIEGLAEAEALDGVMVFHAATRLSGGRIATSGGRVIGVTGLGPDLHAARERAYEAVARIRWPGEHHRTDIALDAVRSPGEART